METVKIRCKSLCVGDWVANRNGSPMQIVAVDEDNAYACEGNEERPWIFGDDEGYKPEPILLTPKILEKNGWSLDPVLQCYTSTPLWLYGEGSINLLLQFPTKQSAGSFKIIDNQKIRSLSDFTWKDRLYIHELQHALRLCGLNKLADNFKV